MKFLIDNMVCEYLKDAIVYDGREIIKTDTADFDMCKDEKGIIYILSRNGEGEILLSTVSGKDVSSKCILKPKNKDTYVKYLNIEYINGWLNGVYLLKHGEGYIIVHHIINSDQSPAVIDSVDEETKIFLFKDGENNLYAIYKNKEAGYKKYLWRSKTWDAFTGLYETEGNIVFADMDEGEFVLSIEEDGKNSVICGGQNIINNIRENLFPVINSNGNERNILFEYQGRILQSVRERGQKAFSKPRYAYFGTFSKFELVKMVEEEESVRTYAAKNARGILKPLVPYTKTAKIKTLNEPPKEMTPKEKEERNIEEILKMLDNKNEYEILSKLCDRVSAIEKILEEIKNGNKAEQE